jgi:hypothetical protein
LSRSPALLVNRVGRSRLPPLTMSTIVTPDLRYSLSCRARPHAHPRRAMSANIDCPFSRRGPTVPCRRIGISKSSVLETDALAGVTVLSRVGFPIMGVKGEALRRVNRPFPRRDNGQQPAHSRFIPPPPVRTASPRMRSWYDGLGSGRGRLLGPADERQCEHQHIEDNVRRVRHETLLGRHAVWQGRRGIGKPVHQGHRCHPTAVFLC